jgi:uncharacterized membrane protein HdeD (DUF308 family)
MVFIFWVLFVVAAAFQFPFFDAHGPYRGWFWLVMLGILGFSCFGFPH